MELLVSIIALTVFLIISLIIVFPEFKELIFGAGEKGQCQFSILIRTMSKELTFGFGEIPAECKANRMTITADRLDKYQTLAKKRIDSYIKNNHPAQSEFPQTTQGRYKWAIERIMANEMVDCYNKGWRGRLDLEGLWAYEFLPGLAGPGEMVCILCTRVKFDKSVRGLFGAQREFEIKPWLDANSREGKTYYTLMTEEQHPLFKGFVRESEFNIDKTEAVVYIAGTWKKAGTLSTYGVGGVAIVDYDKLTTDLGFEEYKKLRLNELLFGIAGYMLPVEIAAKYGETARCTTIIGD